MGGGALGRVSPRRGCKVRLARERRSTPGGSDARQSSPPAASLHPNPFAIAPCRRARASLPPPAARADNARARRRGCAACREPSQAPSILIVHRLKMRCVLLQSNLPLYILAFSSTFLRTLCPRGLHQSRLLCSRNFGRKVSCKCTEWAHFFIILY